ncbi:UDP-N-acetylmuramate dehydrogenase [bacterium]|nr:UDP-N-acetylmuramate dehydrogenase [bacterium]
MNIEQKIQKNIKLAPLTTFNIGGLAEFYLEVENKEELELAFSWAHENKKLITMLGGGSNILINDEGIKGLVLRLANNDFGVEKNRVDCGASMTLTKLGQKLASLGLSGLEWGVGIPGAQLGGAIVGNAGAFGTTTSNIIEEVEVFDLNLGKWRNFNKEECGFDYRNSIFKDTKKYLIFNAKLIMQKKKKEEVEDRVKEILDIRNKKQPKHPNAGSIFKNVNLDYLKKRNPDLAKRAEEEGVIIGGMVSSGWLVGERGLGERKIGGAQISKEHGNFIINKNKATALDVITLISYIKQKIRNEFNIQFQEEIRYLGF